MISQPRYLSLPTLVPILVSCLIAGIFAFSFITDVRFENNGITFLTIGDNRQLWLPQFIEGYKRFWGGGIFSIDLLTNGGASVFGVRPNLMPIYPPFILSYLIFDITNPRSAAMVLAGLIVIHIYLAALCIYLTGRKHLVISSAASALLAASFCFSVTLLVYAEFLPFFIQGLYVPILVYIFLEVAAKTRGSIVLCTFILANFMLTGYPPMLIVAFLSALLTAFVIYDKPLKTLLTPAVKVFVVVSPVLPFVALYYWLQVIHFKSTSAAVATYSILPGLEAPFAFADIKSVLFASIGGTKTEGRLVLGLFQILIVVFALTKDTNSKLSKISAKMSIVVLFGYLLSIGPNTWLPDVFYNVPIVGGMHLYQRFNLFLVFNWSLAFVCAVIILRTHISETVRWAGLSAFLLSIIVLVILPKDSVVNGFSLTFEIFLIGLSIFILLNVRSDTLCFVLLAIFTSFASVAASTMFTRDNRKQADTSILFNKKQFNTIKSFMLSSPNKLVRLLDLIEVPDIQFPRNTGWVFSSTEKNIFNFHGYELHLNADRSYLEKMGGWYGRYDPDFVRKTGVDIVLWSAQNPEKFEKFLELGFRIVATIDVSSKLRLSQVVRSNDPPRVNLQPLPGWSKGWLYENGLLQKVKEGENSVGFSVRSISGDVYKLTMDLRQLVDGDLTVWFGGAQAVAKEPGVFNVELVSDGKNDLWLSGAPNAKIQIAKIQVTPKLELIRQIYRDGLIEVVSNSAGNVSSYTDWYTTIKVVSELQSDGVLKLNLWSPKWLKVIQNGSEHKYTVDEENRPQIKLPAGRSETSVSVVIPSARYLVFLLIFTGFVWAMMGLYVLRGLKRGKLVVRS